MSCTPALGFAPRSARADADATVFDEQSIAQQIDPVVRQRNAHSDSEVARSTTKVVGRQRKRAVSLRQGTTIERRSCEEVRDRWG